MKRTFAVAAGVAALAVAGCGSSSSSNSNSAANTSATPPPTTSGSAGSGGGGGQGLKIAADPSGALKFDKSSLSTKSGSVTITMANASSVQHGVGIKGNGVDKDGSIVGQGGTSTVTASLKPGKYEFYCPVPGHEQAGMKGTLTVK
jgi:plastocyanin